MKKKILFQGSIVAPIKNVVLTKAERKEVEKDIRRVRKLKMPKKCYFEGFKEA